MSHTPRLWRLSRRYDRDAGDDWAAKERETSERLLSQAKAEVIGPLRQMREKNNVSALIRALLHDKT